MSTRIGLHCSTEPLKARCDAASRTTASYTIMWVAPLRAGEPRAVCYSIASMRTACSGPECSAVRLLLKNATHPLERYMRRHVGRSDCAEQTAGAYCVSNVSAWMSSVKSWTNTPATLE